MRRRAFIAALGSVATWPMVARAQQAERVRRVGVLMSTAETDPLESASVAAFVAALGKLGWTTGQNVEIVYRWAAGDSDRMTANARELVSLAPDVLLVKGANVPAARQATSAIPIVFVVLGDVIAQNYVGSFARPGGNITGFTSYERALVGKRLTLLRETVPHIARVLYIRSKLIGTDTLSLFQSLTEDARALRLPVSDAPAENEAEIEQAVESFAQEPDGGLIVAFDAFATVHRAKIVELAAQHRLPAIYPLPAFPQSGGMLSYGFDQDEQFRQAASYVARILAGEKAGDLPVQAPTTFKLVINLKAAKALGLEIPPILLGRADEVIE
jgi:putative tryptophan/tyrosine transport system substrate-binding protein